MFFTSRCSINNKWRNIPKYHWTNIIRVYLHCMCQHLHITLFNLILSFHRSFIPLKRFHFGEVNFCLRIITKKQVNGKELTVLLTPTCHKQMLAKSTFIIRLTIKVLELIRNILALKKFKIDILNRQLKLYTL